MIGRQLRTTGQRMTGHKPPLVVQSINLLSMMPLRIFRLKLLNFAPLASPLKPPNYCRRQNHDDGCDDEDKKADPIVFNHPLGSIGVEALPGTDLVYRNEDHRTKPPTEAIPPTQAPTTINRDAGVEDALRLVMDNVKDQ